VAACLVYCESRILFRMSLAMDVRCATYSATRCMFLNYNFSKEQCTLPEDDRVIETCRNVLSVLM